jgi:transcriptional regulator with XRE-family HTH domain
MTVLSDRRADRRRELAEFLRSRRDRLTPAEVGLPASGRRRTPGLRREEVATLAGIGVTWYTWLEQGRPITPSPSVLNAVARTLLLDRHERRHLFALAEVPEAGPSVCHSVSNPTLAVLLQMEPFPALVQNARMDVLALNRGFAWLLPELAEEPEETRNMLRLVFTNTSMRLHMTDEACARMVATFRGAMAEHLSRPAFKELADELCARSAEFAELWQRHDVRMPEAVRKQIEHHSLGTLTFEHTYLFAAPRDAARIVALVPADERTRDVLDLHVGRAPATPLANAPLANDPLAVADLASA